MRSTGELLYLLLILGAFASFMSTLLFAQLTWRPAARRESGEAFGDGAHPQPAE